MEEVDFSDSQWQRENQRHPSNQVRPPDWVESVAKYEDVNYFELDSVANMLCELHPDRVCHSRSPDSVPDGSDPEDDFEFYMEWDLDDLERKRWGIFKKLEDAMTWGELPYRELWGLVRPDEGPNELLLQMHEVIPWAQKNNVYVPRELVEMFAGTSNKSNSGSAKASKQKRDSTYLAALVLIDELGIETFQHKNSGKLNLKKLAEAVQEEHKNLFEARVAPQNSDVFRRQFKAMADHYQEQKKKMD